MKALVWRVNPEGYTVSRPNLGANTSVLAQTSLAKRPCAREAGGLLTPRVTPSLDFFGGNWRGGCTLSCCVVPIEDETDSEWDPDATDVDTDVGTDNDPASSSAAAASAGSLTYLR